MWDDEDLIDHLVSPLLAALADALGQGGRPDRDSALALIANIDFRLDPECDDEWGGDVLAALLAEAEGLVRAGAFAAALHRIDLWRTPKFVSRAECAAAYAAAMGRV